MNGLLLWAGQNTLVALLLAVLVYGVTRAWCHPPTAHLLWLLVLLKLVAPPMVPITWHWSPSKGASHFDDASVLAERNAISSGRDNGSDDVTEEGPINDLLVATPGVMPDTALNPLAVESAGSAWSLMATFERAIVTLWLGGAALCALVAMLRIARFERLLRDTLPASQRTERLTAEIAARLGVGRVPTVRYVQLADVPMLWCACMRPTIVLPLGLASELSEDRLALVLAHELIHLRRRDHWVRYIELLVTTLYWWNPLVWIVRRQIHQAEDQCCDAWVRSTFPDHTHRYAEVIFEAADRLRGTSTRRPLTLASPFFHTASLKARIEMILHGQFAPRLTRKSKLLVALLALVVIPSAALNAQDDSQAESTAKPAAASEDAPDAAKTSTPVAEQIEAVGLEFSHVVPFEQGATRFADGDEIKIAEVRGTAASFSPGNIYRIKGTYTLASHDRAMLAAYTTARESKDGTSTSYKVQSTLVDKGTGAFTLILPMNCPGWPHVSFYPVGGGSGFGGNYFGTGESTLKQWWGTKPSAQTAATAAAGGADPNAAKIEPPEVTLTSPRLQAVTLVERYVAQIHAHRHIQIRCLERGHIEEIKVKEGQQVKARDTLFQIVPILYQKKLEAQEAERDLAQLDLKNAEKLASDKVVSADEVARQKVKLRRATANAELAKAELDFATVKAPFDGMIGRFRLQQGSLGEEGETVTTLSDNSMLWVYFNVPEKRYLEYVQDPHKDELQVELLLANGDRFNQVGKIAAIETDFNNETGNVPFRADFSNPEGLLRHGQGGTVLLSRILNDAIVIPRQATFDVLDKRYVFVVDKDNVAHQREIVVEKELLQAVVIKKGTLAPDERIVLGGVRQVHDGEKVSLEGN